MENNITYKVEFLVIGAGLAGSAFGIRMLRAGKDILLVDMMNREKKEKLCGGLLGRTAIDELKVLLGDSALDEMGYICPAAFRGVSSYGESVCESSFRIVERKKLDDYCLNTYLKEGGKLLEQLSLISVNQENRIALCIDHKTKEMVRIRFGYIIGADGALSTVRQIVSGHRQNNILALQKMVKKARDGDYF